MKNILRIVCAAALAVICTACSANSMIEADVGLQAVTVDGITSDITAEDDQLKSALGDRYAVLESIFGFDAENPSKILLAKVVATEDESNKTKVYLTTGFGEPSEKVSFYRGVRSDSSYSEYLSVYDGYCFVEEMSEEYRKLTVVQYDGELMTVEKLCSMAEDDIDSGAYENFYSYINPADYTAYRVETGSTKQAVALECSFNGEECVSCKLLVLESKQQ